MTASAVIDIGTARTKVTIARLEDSTIHFEAHSVDTFLPEILDGSRPISGLKEVLQGLTSRLTKSGCTSVVSIGTELLRRIGPHHEITGLFRAAFGPVNIVSGGLEARTFYQSIASHLPILEKSFASLDVGGGSVQLSWGLGESDWGSAPIGTFALEKEFQNKGAERLEAPSEALLRMEEHVEAELGKLTKGLTKDVLYLGSNVMANFFSAATKKLGLPGTNYGMDFFSLSPKTLDLLKQDLIGRRYADLSEYFPENPRFMYGADKLLLIASVAVHQLKTQQVVATNDSVSKGLARMLVENRRLVENLGLQVGRI